MNEIIINRKIESLSRCVERIQEKTPRSREELAQNLDIQDIITLNLERAVQICVDIALSVISEQNLPVPDTMAESFGVLAKGGVLSGSTAEKMRRAAGFRNIAVHAYKTISWDIVWKIMTAHLSDFRDFAREILAYLDDRGPKKGRAG